MKSLSNTDLMTWSNSLLFLTAIGRIGDGSMCLTIEPGGKWPTSQKITGLLAHTFDLMDGTNNRLYH